MGKIDRHIRLDPDVDKKLQDLANANEKNITDVITDLIKNTEKNKNDQLNKYEMLDRNRVCPALAFIDGNWCCVKGRDGKTVSITKIGPSEKDSDEACTACNATINLEKRWEQLQKEVKEGWTAEQTYCQMGGRIDEKQKLINCPISYLWLPFDACFRMDEGLRCRFLKILPAIPIKKTGIRRTTNK